MLLGLTFSEEAMKELQYLPSYKLEQYLKSKK